MAVLQNTLLVLIATSWTIPFVRAFGARLDQLHYSHSHTHQCYRHKSRLYAADDCDYKEIQLSCCEFDIVPTMMDDFSRLFGNFEGTFPFLQEQADALASGVYEENEFLEIDIWDKCGIECNECEIPKDWSSPTQEIDVMEFLGVTRIKPLR